jgi:glc operon protein GlcG
LVGLHLTLAGAEAVVASARGAAERQNLALTIAVVDTGGHLISLARLDGARIGTIAIAIEKARTAAFSGQPTSTFQAALEAGATAILSISEMLAMAGGVPLLVGQTPVGAIGVSGAAPEVDEAIAAAAALSFASEEDPPNAE